VRIASHTETNAVFEVVQVLRENAQLQKLSLSHTRAGRELPNNTRGLLLFSQGDNYWGPPRDSFQVGQPAKGQASYRGWILMDGPGESKEELDRLRQLVKQNPFKPDLHGKSSDKAANQAVHDAGRALLDTAGAEELSVRRRAAADLSILLKKRNGVWRKQPDNWKIPTEAGIRVEVDALRRSDQKTDLALANMAAHCMGMLVTGAWQTPPKRKDDGLEADVIRLVRTTDDPAVKVILLVGLASSKTAAARDAVVAATADPDPGVRKSAVYLVERGTANYFGPGGCIHIGSPTADVDAAGRKIRAIYKRDKTVGAGWGPMRDGLQTRIEIDDDAKPVGQHFRVSLIVRNVADKPVQTPSQAHPIRYFKVLTGKESLLLKTEHIPDPLPAKTIEPGKQVVFCSFVLNDYFDLERPGVYEAWLPETYVALPPRSNRVRLRVEPSKEPRDPRPAAEDSAGLTRERARQIAHDALSKALLEEYGDDARAMLSDDVSDERLLVRRDWEKTEGGKKAIWVALLLAKGGGHCGFAMINDGNGAVLKLRIPTKAGRKKALQRVQKWVKQRGAPAKIEWQPHGWYRMEWRVSERELALSGPFVISVGPEGEPHVHVRR